MTTHPETLVRTRDVLVLRLPGRPRDPIEGQHKRLVVYCSVTLTPMQAAVQLRDAADRLELPPGRLFRVRPIDSTQEPKQQPPKNAAQELNNERAGGHPTRSEPAGPRES